jgi:cyclopropane fatty-acyl-phospholipid synthase-like methyltransferase
MTSWYFDTKKVDRIVRRGGHRGAVGGMWDEVGELQLSILKEHGLEPHHTLLDVGCGSLRGGVHFINYLRSGNYCGVDMTQSLLNAGFKELRQLSLEGKLPKKNLLCAADFGFERFERKFDFALAFSVFTHLPLNNIRVCLERLAPCVYEGGRFFATYFEIPVTHLSFAPRQQEPGAIVTKGTDDPFHYYFSDLRFLGEQQGWRVEPVDDFDHPRAQRLLCFTRSGA